MASRAELASSFVAHPYWTLMCQMLSGTIRSEFEDMLASDERLSLNRAAIVYGRKIMRMPFTDIEQGERALQLAEKYEARRTRRSA